MSTAGHNMAVWNSGIDNACKLIDNCCIERQNILVSEHAENKRVLPSNTPFPGPWRNERTPYLIEPMNSMAIYSPIQREIIVKAAQLGFTAASENVIAYHMDVIPSDVLYISATDDLLLKWSSKRLEPLIDSYGMRSKIFAQNAAKSSKRTGDRAMLKEFFGGSLGLASAQSAPSLRMDSVFRLIRDEIDGAPKYLRTGEGNWLLVSEARTDAFGDRAKILDFSTPGTYLESTIWPEYESGDQRRYFVPCPHCGEFQVLEWGHGHGIDNPNLGMQWEIKDGKVTKAWYVCKFCEGKIQNRHKREMLPAGEWRATSQSYSDFVISRQISSLYSPIGMLSWKKMVRQYLKAESEPEGMRSFVNLRLGLPYRETGARPDWNKVYELRGNYRAGTVPSKDVIFLTAAVDVQRGSEKENGKSARVEMEVCGHGLGYRTWSIEHKVFEGPIDNPYQGAWEKLSEYWTETQMMYMRMDGAKYPIQIALVDSGDGPHTASVYTFCTGWNGVLPSKGMATIKRRKGEPIDEDMNRSIRRFRVAKLETGNILLEINGPFYKQQIYSNLKIPRKMDGPQQANFCEFPIEYGESYYKQLTAEDMIIDPAGGISFRKSSARPNEALDLRVMNLAARDHYINQLVEGLRADAKNRGHGPAAISAINSRTALEWLASTVQ